MIRCGAGCVVARDTAAGCGWTPSAADWRFTRVENASEWLKDNFTGRGKILATLPIDTGGRRGSAEAT